MSLLCLELSADFLLHLKQILNFLPWLVRPGTIWPWPSPLVSCPTLSKLHFPYRLSILLEKRKLSPDSCSFSLLRLFFSWLVIWLETCPSSLGLEARYSVRTSCTTLCKEAPSTVLFAITAPCLLLSWCLSQTVVVWCLLTCLSIAGLHPAQSASRTWAGILSVHMLCCHLSARHMVSTQQTFDSKMNPYVDVPSVLKTQPKSQSLFSNPSSFQCHIGQKFWSWR